MDSSFFLLRSEKNITLTPSANGVTTERAKPYRMSPSIKNDIEEARHIKKEKRKKNRQISFLIFRKVYTLINSPEVME